MRAFIILYALRKTFIMVFKILTSASSAYKIYNASEKQPNYFLLKLDVFT